MVRKTNLTEWRDYSRNHSRRKNEKSPVGNGDFIKVRIVYIGYSANHKA
jgi:hypothetical protein